VKNPTVFPLLYVEIKQKYMNTTINYKIRQTIAAKFISLKLLQGTNTAASSNIDLYNLGLMTVPINLESKSFS
jgi:hypothetical protein